MVDVDITAVRPWPAKNRSARYNNRSWLPVAPAKYAADWGAPAWMWSATPKSATVHIALLSAAPSNMRLR